MITKTAKKTRGNPLIQATLTLQLNILPGHMLQIIARFMEVMPDAFNSLVALGSLGFRTIVKPYAAPANILQPQHPHLLHQATLFALEM